MTQTWEARHCHEPDHNSHWVADHSENCVKAVGGRITISVEAMNITWGNDNRFWKWVKCAEDKKCGFETAAKLIQVSWLEVQGSLDLEKLPEELHGKTYEINYRVKFNVDAFGWHDLPVTFAWLTPDGHKEAKAENLESHRSSTEWIDLHGGQFKVPAANAKGKVEFGMMNTTQRWKGGIQIAGVTMTPKPST